MGMKRNRVLIVEDESGIRMVLEEALDLEGFEVLSVSNGQDALESLSVWVPDVIVLDLMMPVMSGSEFRRAQQKLPESLSSIPVIVLSGAHNAERRAAALEADAVIPKPFDLDEFLSIINRVLNSSAA